MHFYLFLNMCQRPFDEDVFYTCKEIDFYIDMGGLVKPENMKNKMKSTDDYSSSDWILYCSRTDRPLPEFLLQPLFLTWHPEVSFGFKHEKKSR